MQATAQCPKLPTAAMIIMVQGVVMELDMVTIATKDTEMLRCIQVD